MGGMERPGENPAPAGGGATDEDLDRYLRALEQTEAEDAPGPAAALAELLAARLEGADDPGARAVLESLPPPGGRPGPEDQP